MAMRKAGALCCSFCGKGQKEVKMLIAGPAVQICNLCVDICNKIIIDSKQRGAAAATSTEGRRGRRKEKKKAPKKEAATAVKKQDKQPRKTKYIAPEIL